MTTCADPASEFLSRLEGVKSLSGDRWEARCPAHDDRRASLSVTRGDNGAALARCHAGCSIEQIASAAGMTVRELFPAKEKPRRKIAATYDYIDASGTLLYQAVRYDPKDFIQRCPDASGGWVYKLNGVQRVLYRLPELLASAEDDRWVFIPEGERDVDRLYAAGFIGTCNVGGAGKWKPEYGDVLRGRRCCIIPDNDPPGENHARQVATDLIGKAADVRILRLPGLPQKGDLSDWFDAGGAAKALRELVEQSPKWEPNQVERALMIKPDAPKNLGAACQAGEKVLSDASPRTLARAFVADCYTAGNDILLRHWRGVFYTRDQAVYVAAIKEQLRSAMYAWMEVQSIRTPEGAEKINPTRRKIEDVTDALAALVQASVDQMPAWLDDHHRLPAKRIIAFRNGLLDIDHFLSGDSSLIPPTPRWFSTNVLPFDFDPKAPEPTRWWDFLTELWDGDPDAIDLLREWFGYCLTTNTSLQKILLLVGPTRSGKGTIARLLTKLIGPANVCGPTLSGIASNFGLWGLIGKQLAILSDARMSGRADQAAVVERLLTISGEDAITIDRKNLEPVTLTLPTRLMLLSNELPRLADASGALADRFLVLTLKQSFLGREDTGLDAKLAAELPGICLWALDGMRRIQQRKRFTVPASSTEAVDELQDLTSPMKAFIRECCHVAPGRESVASTLYERWCNWCKTQGRDHPGSMQSFGRDIRAALPGIAIRQRRADDGRERFYEGIGIA